MAHTPLDSQDLLVFVRVAELGSLSAASRATGLPRATVTRRLNRLEERLGRRVLLRTNRQLTVTDAGETLLPYARAVLDALEIAETALDDVRDTVGGKLRVSVPSARHEFRQLLLSFRRDFPQVDLEVLVTTDHIDMVERRIDVSLRAATELPPDMIARVLIRSRQITVASPKYLEERGRPTLPEELSEHRCLVGFNGGRYPDPMWPMIGGGLTRVEASLASNDYDLLLDAALAGEGIGLFPAIMVREFLDNGQLEHVLEPAIGTSLKFAILYPERKLMPAATRAFIDRVLEWASGADFKAAAKKG